MYMVDMLRKARIGAPGALQHIIVRGLIENNGAVFKKLNQGSIRRSLSA
jgi:hypothetical protein